MLAPPSWLRPVAVAGAGACAVWVVALVYPVVNGDHRNAPVASVETKAPSVETPSTATPPDAPAVSVAQGTSPVESGSELASESAAPRRASRPAATQARVEQPSDLATVASETPVQGFTGGSEIPGSGTGYVDEYITDQFYLDRGNGGSGTPSVTPVSGRPSDDVYIVF